MSDRERIERERELIAEAVRRSCDDMTRRQPLTLDNVISEIQDKLAPLPRELRIVSGRDAEFRYNPTEDILYRRVRGESEWHMWTTHYSKCGHDETSAAIADLPRNPYVGDGHTEPRPRMYTVDEIVDRAEEFRHRWMHADTGSADGDVRAALRQVFGGEA